MHQSKANLDELDGMGWNGNIGSHCKGRKVTFCDYCYKVHFGANWLVKFDSPPQLVIRSIKTIPEQTIDLNIFVRLWKGLRKAPFK